MQEEVYFLALTSGDGRTKAELKLSIVVEIDPLNRLAIAALLDRMMQLILPGRGLRTAVKGKSLAPCTVRDIRR